MISSITVTLFLIMNPFGNLPVIISLLKDYNKKKRIEIIIKKLVTSLFVIFIFIFFGKSLIYLFLIALAVQILLDGISKYLHIQG